MRGLRRLTLSELSEKQAGIYAVDSISASLTEH